MSAQRLSRKKIRKLRKETGLNITRAWAYGGYNYDLFVPMETTGHLHYIYDLKTKDVEIDPDPFCYTSCDQDDLDAGWDIGELD